MNRKIFNQCIAESNFKELFISEMGWNNPKGQNTFDIEMEENRFEFRIVAERNGFQVMTCEVQSVPSSSFCKKIDTRLRRAANDYICIFKETDCVSPSGKSIKGADCVSQSGNSIHHLWAVPVKKVEKRDIVLVEYTNADAAGFLYEKVNNLSFDLDQTTTITDVVGKVQSAFIINSERITKDFYSGFKKEHTKFAQFISGIDDHIADKDNRNKQWYTSVMLNRLMFCYFIQKKGFLDDDVDYLRHKLERHLESVETQNFASPQSAPQHATFFKSFYKGFLITLFHGGLNAPKHDRSFEDIYGRIPYLNGGMFDVHQLEQDYKDLDISDNAFISLFDFFDRWHWHLDDRITASGRDINPDVLGYIFEQYINDRAQMGAYYTKEDITEYIGRNTIVPYLMDAAIGGLASKRDTVRANNDSPLQSPWQFLRDSGDRYIFDAVKKGAGLEIPEEIAIGIDTAQPNLLERRKHWNERTPERFALPTEIWRETIERLQRYEDIKSKIENGEITEINDFITYNLDIRSFIYDYLNTTDNTQFIEYFYEALQKVTILDPTCGSGAFLFAALNILEPLYEVCITRMQEFHAKDKSLFGKQLDEIKGKYRSNIQYFIYKSIILRNLYGVDIMVEAIEIAKLRLFLKMVAVVDVDRRDPNMGLDPLPDIDFNIRCGNTLVGYATEKDLNDDLDYGDPFAAAELRPVIHQKMGDIAQTYQTFRELQLIQTEEPNAFKRAKLRLKKDLDELNDLLNRKLYQSTAEEKALTYDRWLRTHQPFHWLAEFYEIISGNGGFDVVIGNPPYVEFQQSNRVYGTLKYETIKTYNLHALCVERSRILLRKNGKYGMILPLGAFSTKNMKPLMTFLEKESFLWLSFYHFRPARLFDGGKGASIPTTIFIAQNEDKAIRYSSKVNKFTPTTRYYLFNNLSYTKDTSNFRKSFDFCFPKLSDNIENSILNKVVTNKPLLVNKTEYITNQSISYRTAGGLYWKIVINFPFPYESTSNKTSYLFANIDANVITAFLNSSLQWLICTISFDTLNFKDYYIFNLPLSYDKMVQSEKDKLHQLCDELMENYKANAKHKYRGDTPCYEITANLAKPIIDEIDKVLAAHYGFTEEELDFIINYDIKYRMGEELDN